MPRSWATCIRPPTRRAERREQVGAHAHPARRDAGIGRRLLVAAGREGLVAHPRLGEQERRRSTAKMTKTKIWLLKPQELFSPMLKKIGISLALCDVGDGLAAGEPGDEAAADEEDGQRGDEGGHPQDGDQRAVDRGRRAGRSTSAQAIAGDEARVEIGRREGDREDDRGQAVESSRPRGRGPC